MEVIIGDRGQKLNVKGVKGMRQNKAYNSMIEELVRMQHFGMEGLEEEIPEEDKIYTCEECDGVLTDEEIDAYGDTCSDCYDKYIEDKFPPHPDNPCQ